MKKFLSVLIVAILALAIAVPASAAVTAKNSYTLSGSYTYVGSGIDQTTVWNGIGLTWGLDVSESNSGVSFKVVLPMTLINKGTFKFDLNDNSSSEAYALLSADSILLANNKAITGLSLRVSSFKQSITGDPMGIALSTPVVGPSSSASSKSINFKLGATYDKLTFTVAGGDDNTNSTVLSRLSYAATNNLNIALMGLFNKVVATNAYTYNYSLDLTLKNLTPCGGVLKAQFVESTKKTTDLEHAGFGAYVGVNELKLGPVTVGLNAVYVQQNAAPVATSLDDKAVANLLPSFSHSESKTVAYNFGYNLSKSLFDPNRVMIEANVASTLTLANNATLALTGRNILNLRAVKLAGTNTTSLINDLVALNATLTTANTNVYTAQLLLDNRFAKIATGVKNDSYNFATRFFLKGEFKTIGLTTSLDVKYNNLNLDKALQVTLYAKYATAFDIFNLSASTFSIENEFTYANNNGKTDLEKFNFFNDQMLIVLGGNYNERLSLKLYNAFELRSGTDVSWKLSSGVDYRTATKYVNWIQDVVGIEATYKLNSIFTLYGTAAYRVTLQANSKKYTQTLGDLDPVGVALASNTFEPYIYIKATAAISKDTTVTLAYGDNGIASTKTASASMSDALKEYTTPMKWDKFALTFSIKY